MWARVIKSVASLSSFSDEEEEKSFVQRPSERVDQEIGDSSLSRHPLPGCRRLKPGAGLRLDEPEEGQWIWLVGCPWLFPTQHSTRSLSLHTPFRIKRENRRKKETAYSRTPTVLTSAPDSAVRDGSCALLLIRRHDYFRLFLYISFPSRPASNNGVVRRTTGGILSSCLSLSLFVCLRRLTVRSVFVCLILTGTD